MKLEQNSDNIFFFKMFVLKMGPEGLNLVLIGTDQEHSWSLTSQSMYFISSHRREGNDAIQLV